MYDTAMFTSDISDPLAFSTIRTYVIQDDRKTMKTYPDFYSSMK